MTIKHHLSRQAVAFPSLRKGIKKDDRPPKPRVKGSSRGGRQRRQIADATEGMRLGLLDKRPAMIFVLTTPGFLDHANEPLFIKKFIDTMRKNHGMKNYLWVREFTGNGYPHFHFIAQCDRFDVQKMSVLWSSYFGQSAKNSIRLGTKPTWNGKRWIRKFFINSPRMAKYLSKYIGKGFGSSEARNKRLRTFAISEELGSATVPVVYQDALKELYNGLHDRHWEPELNPPDWLELMQFDPRAYEWRKVSDFGIFFGRPRRKVSENTLLSQK